MGYAGLTPHGYVRKRVTPDSVAAATRKLMPDVISWSDKNIGNWIDEITDKATEDPYNIETYWRDDFADGVFPIRVIKIDDHWAAARGPLYAVVKSCEERTAAGQAEVILTVVDEQGHLDAINTGYWLHQKPEGSRYRHPGEPEHEEELMEEQSLESVVESVVADRDFDPMMITYGSSSGQLEMVHASRVTLNDTLEELVKRGIDYTTIKVWKQLKSRVKIVVEVED